MGGNSAPTQIKKEVNSMTKRLHRRVRTKRIYFGPDGKETSMWWDVRYRDATSSVSLNGSLKHAIEGIAGKTVGCTMSNCAFDNAKAFPHPALLIVFTKSTCLVVDKLDKKGQPCHAVRYGHNYGRIVEANDKGVIKKIVKDDPSYMDRKFTLTPPRVQRPTGPHGGHAKRSERTNRTYTPRGALKRAVDAGLISKPVATQLERAA